MRAFRRELLRQYGQYLHRACQVDLSPDKSGEIANISAWFGFDPIRRARPFNSGAGSTSPSRLTTGDTPDIDFPESLTFVVIFQANCYSRFNHQVRGDRPPGDTWGGSHPIAAGIDRFVPRQISHRRMRRAADCLGPQRSMSTIRSHRQSAAAARRLRSIMPARGAPAR